jgi:hypothetical protein
MGRCALAIGKLGLTGNDPDAKKMMTPMKNKNMSCKILMKKQFFNL